MADVVNSNRTSSTVARTLILRDILQTVFSRCEKNLVLLSRLSSDDYFVEAFLSPFHGIFVKRRSFKSVFNRHYVRSAIKACTKEKLKKTLSPAIGQLAYIRGVMYVSPIGIARPEINNVRLVVVCERATGYPCNRASRAGAYYLSTRSRRSVRAILLGVFLPPKNRGRKHDEITVRRRRARPRRVTSTLAINVVKVLLARAAPANKMIQFLLFSLRKVYARIQERVFGDNCLRIDFLGTPFLRRDINSLEESAKREVVNQAE